jgi:hypothetical protein
MAHSNHDLTPDARQVLDRLLHRQPVCTLGALATLDSDEIVEGYLDGRENSRAATIAAAAIGTAGATE